MTTLQDVANAMADNYKQRVVAERTELASKREALHIFLTDQPRLDRLGVPAEEIARLRRQYTYMGLYIDVLDERLRAM